VVDANADPTGVGRLVVDAVGDRLAQVLVDEVVDVDFLGLTRRLPLPPAVAEPADKLLLLGVHGDHRLPLLLVCLDPPVDVLELGISIRVTFALDRLPIGLQTVAQAVKESVDRALAGGMPSGLEFGGQLGRTLACPAQRRHRIATGHGIDQGLQVTEEVGIVIDQSLSPATLSA